MDKSSDFDLQVIIASGLRDVHRAVLGFATALAAAVSNMKVVVFLSMDGAIWANENEGNVVQSEGFESISDYIDLLQESGGKIEICANCTKNSCSMSLKPGDGKLREGIELAGISASAIRAGKTQTLVF